MAILTATNVAGVKAAGRASDILTVAKLGPSAFFSLAGHIYTTANPAVAESNFSAFFPYGMAKFGPALVLISWAYPGFQISTIPPDETKDPSRTIPKAIVLGISIAAIFHLTTNTALFGVRHSNQFATDTVPLASATNAVLGTSPTLALIGESLVGFGALISVAGSDESGRIDTQDWDTR